MALSIAAGTPIHPVSPVPLAPSGFDGAGWYRRLVVRFAAGHPYGPHRPGWALQVLAQ
jgi:hypothetical protein